MNQYTQFLFSIDYLAYLVDNLYKCEILFKNNERKQILGTIQLTKSVKDFDRIVIEVGNYSVNLHIDMKQFTFEVPTIIYNDTATTDNHPGDYSLIFHGRTGAAALYFRENKNEIYVTGYLDSNDTTIYAVYGIKYR